MKVAVFSDSHDHLWNLSRAISMAIEAGVERIIHCGDLISPFMIDEFDAFPGQVEIVDGNNPGDQFMLARKVMERKERITYHGPAARIDLDGLPVAVVHDPALARDLAASGSYKAVFFGHTHLAATENVDGCLLHNPGALLGNKEPACFSIFDTEGMEISRVEL